MDACFSPTASAISRGVRPPSVRPSSCHSSRILIWRSRIASLVRMGWVELGLRGGIFHLHPRHNYPTPAGHTPFVAPRHLPALSYFNNGSRLTPGDSPLALGTVGVGHRRARGPNPLNFNAFRFASGSDLKVLITRVLLIVQSKRSLRVWAAATARLRVGYSGPTRKPDGSWVNVHRWGRSTWR